MKSRSVEILTVTLTSCARSSASVCMSLERTVWDARLFGSWIRRVRPALKSSWFRIGKGRSRQSKLLAITALRHSECPEAMKLLGELAQDGESLVRTKAAYALKHLESPVDSAAADLASVAEEDTAP